VAQVAGANEVLDGLLAIALARRLEPVEELHMFKDSQLIPHDVLLRTKTKTSSAIDLD
jgi:hypothetical protein